MWLKILQGIYIGAKATGLDKKLLGWLRKKVQKSQNKYDDKVIEAGVLLNELYNRENE